MPDPCIVSSPRIALSVTGTPRALTADTIPSPHDGNIFQNRGDGVYVPGLTWITGNAFPSAPDDGMIVGVSPANGVSWQFRFNADSTAVHQWEFIGGGAWYNNIEGSDSFVPGGANDWHVLSPSGPDITPNIDGVYTIRFGAAVNASTAGTAAEVGVSIGGTAPNDNDVARSAGVYVASVGRTIERTVNSGQRIRLQYRDAANSSGPTAIFSHRWLEITPVRVA